MSDLIKVIGEADIDRILIELENKKVGAQFPLHGTHENDFEGAVGRVYTLRHDETDFKVPLYKDMKYTYSILEKYNLYRARVMKLTQGKCYSYHRDNTWRVHIPLESNDKCFFVINDEVIRMPADGSVYLVNTKLDHTAINANLDYKFVRVHLMGNISDEDLSNWIA